ncbi:MAG: division/cell wall cluster transcriptional repressor MraZ [Gammaproteobacteria bacterium]|jgi:MraZ protein|nr:division/cell wall cluster transcriptional repressor MraZ [Gammaproteobacteria bacterium]HJP37420.1 division/cell wall cluster transcriptional repressor MraZ [Gammaproteobacteria bacterium]
MFKGFSTINIDAKGRLAIPVRHRDLISAQDSSALVLTLNPWDRCLWLYPASEWEVIEAKLKGLSDFDRESRRTKQIIRGYAADCALDGQGRVLLPTELRDFALLDKRVAFLGQGNKFEIWNEDIWTQQRDEWLDGVNERDGSGSAVLNTLSL